MIKKSAIRHRTQTNIVARIIYRIICLSLVAIGFLGLFFTSNINDKRIAYQKRTSTTAAVVVTNSKDVDKYGYDICSISYTFKVDHQQYGSATSPSNTSTNYNCNTKVGQKISLRYEPDRPTNNAYGDNEQAELMLMISTIVLLIMSVIPLGVGFVGLVVIHKVIQAGNGEAVKHLHYRYSKTKKRSDARPEPNNGTNDV